MIRYQREDAAAVLEEALPLMRAHWAEIAYSAKPFDPNLEAYLAMDAAGLLRLYTVRAGASLAGYTCFVVTRSINHRTEIHAQEAGTFVLPEHRRGRIALRLLDFAEAALVCGGAREVHYAVPKEHPTLGRILARRGYTPTDTVYVRRF